jgi:hypothetical protein
MAVKLPLNPRFFLCPANGAEAMRDSRGGWWLRAAWMRAGRERKKLSSSLRSRSMAGLCQVERSSIIFDEPSLDIHSTFLNWLKSMP